MLQTEANQESLRCRVTASEAAEEVCRTLRAARLEQDLLELPGHFDHGSGIVEASLSVGNGILLFSWEDKLPVGQPSSKVTVLLGFVVLSVGSVSSLEKLLKEVVTGEV